MENDFEALKDLIKRNIDIYDTLYVLDAVVEVLRDKAEHIRTDWQDEEAALLWEDDANSLETCVESLDL